MGNRRLNRGKGRKIPMSFWLILIAAIVLMFLIYLFAPIPAPFNKYVLFYGIPLVTAIGIFIKWKFF